MNTGHYLAGLITEHLETLVMHTVASARHTIPLYKDLSVETVRVQFLVAYSRQAEAFANSDPAAMIRFTREAVAIRLQQGAAVEGMMDVLAIIEASILLLTDNYPPTDLSSVYMLRQQIKLQFQAVRLAVSGLQLEQLVATPLPRRKL